MFKWEGCSCGCLLPGIFTSIHQIIKQMRSNRSKSTDQLYSDSNRILIDNFDPNLAVPSIVAMISIQNLGPNSKLDLNLSPNSSIISIIGQIWSKTTIYIENDELNWQFGSNSTNFWYNSTNFWYNLTIFDWIIATRSILID